MTLYYVNPLQGGRLIVVVGDVSGKGLRAASASSPSAVLKALNSGLVGRAGGGFVTAYATISKASHYPVYRDGQELNMRTSLPLGIAEDIEIEEVKAPHGRYLLLYNGVIEAENKNRVLFGFDRTSSMSALPAEQLDNASEAWGQNDDITVVTVRTNATEAPACP